MSKSLTRRGFLASAAVAGLAAWPAVALGRCGGRRNPGEATYFEITGPHGPFADIDDPELMASYPVRILLGSAAGSSNSLVYAVEGGSLLVDAATPPLGARLVQDAARVGGPFGASGDRPGFVGIVVNTHHHADHTGGNWALASAGPRPRVLMHARTDERVRGMVERYRAQASGGVQAAGQIPDADRRVMAVASAEAFAAAAEAVTPDDFGASATFHGDTHQLDLGDRPVVLRRFGPGHTDNDVVVHLPEENLIHTGDLLFSRMHPYFADDSGATCRGWIESVGRIIELCDDQTVVVPGHGPIGNVRELHRQRDYLEQLWEAVELEVARGTPKESVAALTWAFMEGLERDQIRPRAIGAVYDEVVRSR